MRPLLLVLVVTLAGSVESRAQATQPLARATLFGQVAGDGLALSLNADYMVTPQINARVGYSTAIFAQGIPLVVSYHMGEGRRRLEVGGGTLLNLTDGEDDPTAFGLVHAGYRVHPRGRGWLFRVGFALVFDPEDIVLLPGVSVGRGLRLGR